MEGQDRKTRRPGPVRRWMRRGLTLGGTLGVIGLAGGAVVGLSEAIAARTETVAPRAAVPPAFVETRRLAPSDGFSVARAFPGQVEAARSVDLAFEAGGTVTEIAVDEGDAVAAGAVLARLDIRRLEAERDRLEASRAATAARAELARRTTARQERLADTGFAAAQRVDEASLLLLELEARLAEIDAGLADVAVRIDKAVLRAPFAGRIGARLADEGTTAGAGVPVLTVLEDAAPTFRVGLPPRLADGLAPGDALPVTVGDAVRTGTITAIRPDLDPVTRTRTVLLALDGPDAAFRRTGTVEVVQRIEQRGFAVPLTALRAGLRGLWTVPVAEPDGAGGHRIALAAVTMIHAGDRTAFVAGTLREGARVVTDGTHRVVAGQAVRVDRAAPATLDVAGVVPAASNGTGGR